MNGGDQRREVRDPSEVVDRLASLLTILSQDIHRNEQQQVQEHQRAFERRQNELKIQIDALLEAIEDLSRQVQVDEPQMMRLSETNDQLKASLEALREEITSSSLQLEWDRLGNLETQLNTLTASTTDSLLRVRRAASALRAEKLRQKMLKSRQQLGSKLDQLLEYDRQVERTGNRGSPPVKAEELEGKLSEYLEQLRQEEQNFQEEIRTNRN